MNECITTQFSKFKYLENRVSYCIYIIICNYGGLAVYVAFPRGIEDEKRDYSSFA